MARVLTLTRPSPRRAWFLWRHMSLLDRVASAVPILYLVCLTITFFGHLQRLAQIFGLLSIVAVLYLTIRVVGWFRNRILWRLRNRLIVTYLFIAVVPVVLLSTMLFVGMYLLFLQFGAHLLQDDLQERANVIDSEAQSIAGAIEQVVTHSDVPIDQKILLQPTVAGVVAAARGQSPRLRIVWNAGKELLEAGTTYHYSGVAKYQNKLWFISVDHRVTSRGPFSILVGAALDSSLLDGLPSELGPIRLTLLAPATRGEPGIRLAIDGRLYVPGEIIATSQRKLEPKRNWLDWAVSGASTFVAADVDGRRAALAPVLASFSLRPSSLGRSLFSSVGAIGPYLVGILFASAVVFLILEIAALITGVMLTRTITGSVGELYEATLSVREGDFGHRIRIKTKDQLGALSTSFNEMTESVGKLIEEQQKRQRLEQEIEIASEVQQQLFPQTLPSIPGMEVAAICRPAKVVSGDYYDFIQLGPSRLGIAIADISGKGIFAALLMASVQAALRSMATCEDNCRTADIVSRLNGHLFKNTSDDRYATLFYAVYDSERRWLTYTNAGHLAPFLVCDGCVQSLAEGGTVVGLFEDSKYVQNSIPMPRGALLVAFSDGLTESENAAAEEFGTQSLVHGDHFAGFKHHVGEKAFVAPGKRCRDQSRDELHAALKPPNRARGKSLGWNFKLRSGRPTRRRYGRE